MIIYTTDMSIPPEGGEWTNKTVKIPKHILVENASSPNLKKQLLKKLHSAVGRNGCLVVDQTESQSESHPPYPL